jgi:hypothetical protein
MTLDEVFLVHEIGRCKLLKIDCEGMEYETLLGAQVLDKVEYLAEPYECLPAKSGVVPGTTTRILFLILCRQQNDDSI